MHTQCYSPTVEPFIPMTDSNIGRLLVKRYQLQELLGAGAMGRVYLAKDILLGGVPVAVKFLTLSIDNQKIRVLERFEQEAKTCALLGQKSIHIVRVMDYGVDENGSAFYVMEYLQGKSLNAIIRLKPLSLTKFLNFARQISLGLQCAHQGIQFDGVQSSIVHRDIKPSNMLVIQDASFGELVKVLDFGIAKLLQADSSQTNYYMGTWAYSSPEQMEGKELDNRSDIYSLGIMMYEMLTGKLPIIANSNSFGGWYKAHRSQPPSSFEATNPRLEIPLEVENLVMSCLAKSPSDRPQNISEIVHSLILLEQRYGGVITTSQGVEEAIAHQLPTRPSAGTRYTHTTQLAPTLIGHDQTLIAEERELNLISWPKNKPVADIVFTHPLRIDNELTAALWVMLPQQEIQKRLSSTRYNQFLFIMSPHPIILWITVLYTREHGPKWFPYYLDMKTRWGEQITKLLGETGCYKVLLFARESPQNAYAYLILNIAAAQRQKLQQWFITSQNVVSTADAQLSKSMLRKEFDKIKPKILQKLEEIDT